MTTIEATANAGTDIIELVTHTPVIVLIDPEKRDLLLAEIKREILATPVDVTTVKGQKVIKALAMKIAHTKTAVEAAGKELNAARKAETDKVNAQRTIVQDALQALQDEARKPLTELEAQEEAAKVAKQARQAQIDTVVQNIRDAAVVKLGATSAGIQDRLKALNTRSFEPEAYGDRHTEVVEARAASAAALVEAIAKLEQDEAQAAELAALRATQTAAQQEESKALAATQAAEREAQKRIDAAEAETVKLQLAENARLAGIKAEEDATRERLANKAHRLGVRASAEAALVAFAGITPAEANKIVLAIAVGQIPNVTLKF